MAKATNKSDEWIEKVVRDYPSIVMDDGCIRTCPVRLTFPALFKANENDNGDLVYGTGLLFPAGAPADIYLNACYELVQGNLPEALQEGGPAVHNPLHDQGEKSARYDGYVPGALLITANSQQRVPCVDQRMAPITDPGRVYPGVWAICQIRPYWFNVKQKKKGPTFGLNAVMIVADDEDISGGSVDVNKVFGGIKIEAGVAPSAAFGAGAIGGNTGQTEAPRRRLFGR